MLELLSGDVSLARRLRAPAISRLQKIHNMDVFFSTLAAQGLDLTKREGKLHISVNYLASFLVHCWTFHQVFFQMAF